MKGGVFLRKTPLDCAASAYSNSETAVKPGSDTKPESDLRYPTQKFFAAFKNFRIEQPKHSGAKARKDLRGLSGA
jgi:hypothetical protein